MPPILGINQYVRYHYLQSRTNKKKEKQKTRKEKGENEGQKKTGKAQNSEMMPSLALAGIWSEHQFCSNRCRCWCWCWRRCNPPLSRMRTIHILIIIDFRILRPIQNLNIYCIWIHTTLTCSVLVRIRFDLAFWNVTGTGKRWYKWLDDS